MSKIYILNLLDYDGCKLGRTLKSEYFKNLASAEDVLNKFLEDRIKYPKNWEFLPNHHEYERPNNRNLYSVVFINTSYCYNKILFITQEELKENL